MTLPKFLILASQLVLASTALAQAAPAPAGPAAAAASSYLKQAKHGVATLQDWYTESTGLYQTTGWWNAGNSITVLANYSRLAQTDAYFPTFANTLKQAQTTFPAFLDNYYDDEGWWALAWIDVYDLTQDANYLQQASTIFADMTGGWDSTCGGGIWWSKDRNYKNAIANELFLSVAAHLASRTTGAQQSDALGWAQKEWTWFKSSGMINSENLINDGLTTDTCANNGQTTWSYNQGVILGGLTALNGASADATLLPAAAKIANAAITHLTDANGVLHDVCEPNCGNDGVEFKGVFLRNLMDLQAAKPTAKWKRFENTNAQSIWKTDQGPNYEFGTVWSGPFDAANGGSQNSALDAILAAAASAQ